MSYEINVHTFMQMSQTDRDLIIEFLQEQVKTENLVSLQGDDCYDTPTIYGLHSNTSEWVSNYNQNGGLWNYESPKTLLEIFQSPTEIVINTEWLFNQLNPLSRAAILESLEEHLNNSSSRVSIKGYLLDGGVFFKEIVTVQECYLPGYLLEMFQPTLGG